MTADAEVSIACGLLVRRSSKSAQEILKHYLRALICISYGPAVLKGHGFSRAQKLHQNTAGFNPRRMRLQRLKPRVVGVRLDSVRYHGALGVIIRTKFIIQILRSSFDRLSIESMKY